MSTAESALPFEGQAGAERRPLDPDVILEYTAALVPALARALGNGHEVVLHDLRRLPSSIVAIEGDVTGRPVGGPITDLALRHLRSGHVDHLFHYRTVLADGRTIRSSTLFLKDSAGVPVGCLCINSDLTHWLQAERVLRAFVGEEQPSMPPNPAERPAADSNQEMFVSTVDELAATMIRAAIEAVGVPVELMQKQHKLAAVRELDARGLFLIRDAVDIAARALGVTRYTIYNYLNQIRSSDDHPTPAPEPVAIVDLSSPLPAEESGPLPPAQTQLIRTDRAPSAIGPYAQGVTVPDARNFLFVSGQLPLDPATGLLVPGDAAAQLRAALSNALAVVEAAGGGLQNVAQVTLFLRDLELYSVVNEAYRDFFGEWRPARSLAGVSALPRDALLEVSMIAVVPGQTDHPG